ncbi:helix-turn-helix transcriptional regulator [Streptomyces sp. DSM 44917]|uniref:Helix-turn-helix transcriptional regulator n=1 Tax=Streptomyces boetiae TaxID=3075541 RepID=A0ABU2L6W5_9ACTN|nr:helix-turn-helix transcriptional regulator [Streptomyces sp. DSM 44917]MDT0307308.1 helix-turn-helix transcriptional regulator [Streptomyces sp. DSM 44917]
MGRPEKPLPSTGRALRELAAWLRAHRREAELTYAKLSRVVGYHPTTLQRAASGTSVPRIEVVEAYARACGGNVDQARRLWRMARYEATAGRLGTKEDAYYRPSRPELIRDMADLLPAMVDLYERAGAPPLRAMEQRAGGHGELPHSTVHRILHGKAVPTRQQFIAFIEACGIIAGKDRVAWLRAWGRIQEATLHKSTRHRAWHTATFTTGPSGHRPDTGTVAKAG